MKILHIDNSPAVTGAYKALLSWCRQHPEWEHVWVLPEGASVVSEVKQYYTCYELPFVEIGRSPAKLLRYIPALLVNAVRLRKIIRKEQPDLLHANDLYNLVPYFARRATGKKLPVVVHARMLRRSFPAKIYDFWKRWHLKRADAIIAVSQAIKKDWNNEATVTVVYDPIVVTERYPPYVFSAEKQGKFRFLYLANYIRGKGQDDALQAIQQLHVDGITNFTVDFYGATMGLEKNEQYKEELRHFAATQGLDAYLSFNDAVTDVEQLMKQYDALLHFSHAESFGMICYEALYYGLPVISTDCGGPAEMMQPGKTGLLVPVGDLAALSAAMTSWILDPQQCRAVSEAAAPYLKAKFGTETDLSGIFKAVMHREPIKY